MVGSFDMTSEAAHHSHKRAQVSRAQTKNIFSLLKFSDSPSHSISSHNFSIPDITNNLSLHQIISAHPPTPFLSHHNFTTCFIIPSPHQHNRFAVEPLYGERTTHSETDKDNTHDPKTHFTPVTNPIT